MKALILAGGFGTRLKSVVADVPKPMASIAGKPFLEHQMRYLRKQGIEDIVLAVHYMSDKIKSFFTEGKRLGVNITYSEEETPLGTGGAIKNAQKYLGDETFLVLNGDTYSKLDLSEFLKFHRDSDSQFSVSLKESEEAANYGTVLLEGNKIVKFIEKDSVQKGLINTGAYLFSPEIFELIKEGRNVSLEREVFPSLVSQSKLFGYRQSGYFMDIGRPETYMKFKEDILKEMSMSAKDDIRKAMQRISDSSVDLILITDEGGRLLGVLNNGMISSHLLKGGGLEDRLDSAMITNPITAQDTDSDSRITDLLSSGINRLPILNKEGYVKDVRFRVEEAREEVFQILQGKSPLRVSFAGGGTDLPYFFDRYGGVVVSSTINKYCHITAVKRADSKILVESDSGSTILDSRKISYDGNFDLLKAIYKIMKPGFGVELYIHNDIPFGRGLGSSASLSVLVAKILGEMGGIKYGDQDLAAIAFKAETEELGIKGGWQDQYAAAVGGFNFMEFEKGKTLIYPLRVKEDVINELNSRLLLYSVGGSHVSGEKHEKQERNFLQNEDEVARNLNEMKGYASEIKDSLLMGDLGKIGKLLHESWIRKRNLSPSVSNSYIDGVYDTGLKNGAEGGKLLGSGGAGYMLFFYSPKKRNDLVSSLKKLGGEILDFNFEFSGAQIWPARSY
jgi:D-glycero-alpha-D-manno-heptose-7-phosphate kinase